MAMWHGQFLMTPKIKPYDEAVHVMVARHEDGELIAQVLTNFNMGLVRGAGAGIRRKNKGGAVALKACLKDLKNGISIGMTADVPPGPARVCGLGLITMARLSGRPILPCAVASSRYFTLNTWSRFTINLPFSKLAFVVGDPLYIPKDADEEQCERYRVYVETVMNDVTKKAYKLADADYTSATPASALHPDDTIPRPFSLKLYKFLTHLARPIVPYIIAHRAKRGKEEIARKNERFGQPKLARPEGYLVWIHAASVGETNAVLPLITELKNKHQNINFLLTTGTVTSAELAQKRLPDRAIHQYIPFDAPKYVDSFLQHWQPNLALFTESEIWPNLITQANDMGVKLVLLNGRMSDKSYRKWRRNLKTAYAIFGCFSLIMSQNRSLSQKFHLLGGRNVLTTGNLKVDSPVLPVHQDDLTELSSVTHGRPIFMAASTHPGEDEIIVATHKLLKTDFSNLLTIITPRHPDRGAQISDILTSEGLTFQMRSENGLPQSETDIYLADTIGDLGTLYALSPISFIGGSLVPHGGQNPVEAIRLQTTVITGPHIHNFEDTYQELFQCKAAKKICSAEELAQSVRVLLEHPEKVKLMQDQAQAALTKLAGALPRTLDALTPYLPDPPKDPELRRAS